MKKITQRHVLLKKTHTHTKANKENEENYTKASSHKTNEGVIFLSVRINSSLPRFTEG